MRKIFSFLTLYFSFMFLFAGWGPELCEDQTCSGHGKCKEDGRNEWCACYEGYIAKGMKCVQGCSGVTCSGHGTCSVVSGSEACSCEAGFHASGLNCILNEASTSDTLAILNENECYGTGNCHYRFIFATNYYDFTPSVASRYDIVVNVKDSENVWHNYRKTVAQCAAEGVCDNVDAQYVDFWFQHNVNGNQYIAVEIFGNRDDAYDHLYHDVSIDYCYGVNCGTGGTCDGTSGHPVCTCGDGYVLKGGICEEGWFEDENLAAVVVELLQYKGYEVETEADIEPEMLSEIEYLALKHKNISSLAGIGHLSSLSVLDISENNISDLSPLEECSGLTVLNMSGNPANNLTPLSNLPLVSLDVSYSGVYNFNPLVSVSTLYELIFADTENGKHGIIKPETDTVPEWLSNQLLLGCNEPKIGYEQIGNKYYPIEIGSGCPKNGSCVDGKCECNDGYSYYPESNSCFNPNNCGKEYHPDMDSGRCVSNTGHYPCGKLPENAKLVSDDSTLWNGSEYVVPAGRTTELCHREDDGCENSICQWDCRDGYFLVKDNICTSVYVGKSIPVGALNQLMLPNISRQDVALEPIPGVPSFAPVFKAGLYYSSIWNQLEHGWYLDLPRVELNINDFGYMLPVYGWDQQTVYVYMPWGKEEYSVVAEKKCYDSDNKILPCGNNLYGISNFSRVEITYYPAPGQNLFSYVVLETTGEACGISPSYNGNYFDDHAKGKDTWKITRYGDDGSVTEFYRGTILTIDIDTIDPTTVIPRNTASNAPKYASRPASYDFMDYIPISKHTTRDKKVTSFKYDWQRVEKNNWKFLYYSIQSIDIIDPLKRVIRIESDSAANGLMGKPDTDHKSIYEPLDGNITVSVGKANALESFKKVAKYNFKGDFGMKAEIYKDEKIYREDEYSNNGNIFHLDSYYTIIDKLLYLKTLAGQTTWKFKYEGHYPTPIGYTERKLVKDSSEYLVKTVRGKFYKSTQGKYYKPYSLFFLENGNIFLATTTIYSHEKNGSPDKKRIVEDYFTNWLQPTKRVTCERDYKDEEENCDGITNTVREEIRYNVSGSPIYFKNADGQVTVDLYDTTEKVSHRNYKEYFTSNPDKDSFHKLGTLACSAVYSLDADNNAIDAMLKDYISFGFDHDENWCSNTDSRKVMNYKWEPYESGELYDLKTVIYPDGKEKSFTYDYEITGSGAGKIRGETITGSNKQNSLQTCYEYDHNYQLTAQGIGTAQNCDSKKGFAFGGEGGLLMTRDYSFDENKTEILENNYIYDSMGRKIAERNSAGVSTVYVYDSLDRVVFTFFGCNLNNDGKSSVFGRVYEPYNFNGDDLAGENGRGVEFRTVSGQFPYSLNATVPTSDNKWTANCQYYRKYNYDLMSNLTETYFFEYWGVNENNQIKPLDRPKIIKQETKYDMLGRAVKSCQFDVAQPSNKRCIETEHDAFGNIVKKEEAVYDQNNQKRNDVHGEIREITYDHRNRPLTVTVDGLKTEEYSYNNGITGNYFGYDTIKNKYKDIDPLITYKDKWGRAAKSVDPFGNETETTYESDYSDNIVSQTTTSSGTKTGGTSWTYDDLDRKLSETREQFIPGSKSTTNVNHVTYWDYDSIGNVVSVESSDGTKQSYFYDSLNRPVETINYEKINSNDVETSYFENSYDSVTGRLFRTETTRNSQTITEDYGFDTFGRVTSVKTTDSSTQNPQTRYRVKFYNTGGQVIWEADEESDGSRNDFNNLKIFDVEVGNQKYYTYNAFGDLEKTVYIMTNNGRGLGNPDPNPWLNDSHITTNFTYDIFGRITSRTNDRSGVTAYNYYQNNTAGSHRRNKLQSIQISPALTDNDTGYQDSDSSTQTYTYTYDDKGDELTVAYQEGNYLMEVAFTRDAYGRIISKTSDGSVPVTQTFTYNGRNLLETATDTVGNAAATSVTRLYDSFGNPYSESVSSGNVTKTVSRRMTDAKTYQFTYPDGKTLRKTATGNDLDSIEYNNSEIASYSRADGVLTAITKGQNLTETFSYNTWNQLANHTINNANADIYDMTYGYSRGWHLIEKADGIRNTSDKYSYDSYYRLKEVKYDFANNTAARTDSFYQDGVHNIEQSTENGTTFAWGVDKLNRLREKKVGNNTEVAYGYDERNNMISEDRSGITNDRSYIYDDLNRLIEVKDGSNQTIATYTYDAFNRRITKTVGTTTERYSYDDWNIVEISTNSNDYTNIIDSGTDRHIAIEVTSNNTSTLYYFLTDERGNVTALTDANGNILERYRYRVYGDFEILDSQFSPKNCNNQTCYATNLHNFLWGGSLYEPETGLYWMRNRYYHIDMHRFINQDPIGIWGDANNLGNGFAYVAGMVIEASDPTGLDVIITVNRNEIKDGVMESTITVESTKTGDSWQGEGKETIQDKGIVPEGTYENAQPRNDGGSTGNKKWRIEYIDENGKAGWTNVQIHRGWSKGHSSGCVIIGKDKEDAKQQMGAIQNIVETDGGKITVNIVDPASTKVSEGVVELSNGTKLEYEQYKNTDGSITVKYSDGTIVNIDKYGNKTILKEGSEINKLKADGLAYPTPDGEEPSNAIQKILMNNILAKMLKRGELEQPPFFTDTSTGPNGAIKIYRNPYYVNKDPLKAILFDGNDGTGKPMIYRNPYVPANAEYGYDSTTYEKWQQKGFVQPNVDPYSNLQQGAGFIQTNVDPYWY